MSYLQIKQLGKTFGDFTAVESISLSVEKGEFISLLGPSGCGKTTTLQMVAGFVDPTRGRILLHGNDITHTRPEKRGMGVVFQSYALFPHMTVAENIGFGLEMRGVPRAERLRRVDEALDLVRLPGLGKRFPKELSGGQRQRVAIARALAVRPEVLLLDEPMSNLDAKLRENMHVELRSIQQHLGITTILVTHDQVEAMTMSDRIALMHGGRIVQLATPYEAYEQPNCSFASTFLGKTNVFGGTVESSNDRFWGVRVGQTLMEVPSDARQIGKDVNVYLRPEKVTLAEAGQGVPATVRTRLFLGNHWLLELDSEIGPLSVSHINIGAAPPAVGASVRVSWLQSDLRILDTEAAHG
ncbi:ABC transporter ATP-binding protein [Acidovorax sp. JG5]|uniref:ABC transporter ATP-binding protein n=1 Tax=Acidovorax sp. JG5 TaxID=2822718 RepID=UPI001B340462|nr:ABC transporter ATP-binding protein [Acidovorax sp. JG5]MBP3981328.1 ABC transporter ATP-binding protein [Acidovorax sp. JG5]